MFLNLLRKKDGQALVQIAVMMSVLIGFVALVVDVGGMYLTKTQLQRMADSGAVAGAQFLPNMADAESQAVSYVYKNRLPGYSINPDDYTVDADASSGYKITVTVSREAMFGFAQVLGITPPNIPATAIASRTGGLSGLRPWALTGNEDFHYTTGEKFTLKEGGGNGERGWFNAIQFKSTDHGANIYKEMIETGCPYNVNINDLVYAENGNMAAGDKVVEKLIAGTVPVSGDYQNISLTDKRVVFVPEVDADLRIIGFAAVYITSVGVPKNGEVDVVFLNDTFFTGNAGAVNPIFKTRLEYQ